MNKFEGRIISPPTWIRQGGIDHVRNRIIATIGDGIKAFFDFHGIANRLFCTQPYFLAGRSDGTEHASAIRGIRATRRQVAQSKFGTGGRTWIWPVATFALSMLVRTMAAVGFPS